MDARRLVELVRKLDDLGLAISAKRHPKAEDDGLVAIATGRVLLEEPREVFAAWRKRTLILYESSWLSPFVLAMAVIVWADLETYGTIGPMTTILGSIELMVSAGGAVAIFFDGPPSGWVIYERGLALRSPTATRPSIRYEDCAYAAIRRLWPFKTSSLRVYLKGWGTAGSILVGDKKHAYGDVDRLVELLESKGVPVER